MPIKKLLVVLSVALSGAASAQEVSPVIGSWGVTHAAAAAELATLVRNDPEGMRRMFLWNHDHPLRAQAFLVWINAHPDRSLDDFIASHRYWPVVDLVIKPYHATFEAFVAWGRAHPKATGDLASQPRGLSWVGYNVYGSLWDTRAPTPATDAPEPQRVPLPAASDR